MAKTKQTAAKLKMAGSALFRAGLCRLVRELDRGEADGLPLLAGVRVFDRLGHAEKLAALEQAAHAVLDDTQECLPQTAIAEGCIAAVYAHLIAQISMEVDEGRATAMRRLVRAACADAGLKIDLPKHGSNDVAPWIAAIGRLLKLLLPERHWERAWPCPDAHPLAARSTRRELGIVEDEYFSTVPPDPSASQLLRIRRELRRLVAPPSRSGLTTRRRAAVPPPPPRVA